MSFDYFEFSSRWRCFYRLNFASHQIWCNLVQTWVYFASAATNQTFGQDILYMIIFVEMKTVSSVSHVSMNTKYIEWILRISKIIQRENNVACQIKRCMLLCLHYDDFRKKVKTKIKPLEKDLMAVLMFMSFFVINYHFSVENHCLWIEFICYLITCNCTLIFLS